MNNLLFATNIKAVLEDDTEVENVKGFLIDDKRVYKTSDNTVLTGNKKIKNILNASSTVPIDLLTYISTRGYE